MQRVSSYGNQSSLLCQMMRLESEMAEKQEQSATGLVSTDYADYGALSGNIVTMEAERAKSEEYVQNSEIVANRVDTSYSALDSMTELLAEFQVLLSSSMSNNGAEDNSLNASAAQVLENFSDLCNTQYNGQYLFAGTMTDTVPVDLSSYTAQTYPSTVSTDYYQGNDGSMEYKASNNKVIEYNQLASSEGIEKAIRAMSLAANCSEDPQDDDAIEEAYNLCNEAIDGILAMQTSVSLTASEIELSIDQEIDYQLYLDSVITDLTSVDTAQAISDLELLQTQLEASYAVNQQLSSMSLFEYL
jgi:flagellar hook-associated protein 3 FlgL